MITATAGTASPIGTAIMRAFVPPDLSRQLARATVPAAATAILRAAAAPALEAASAVIVQAAAPAMAAVVQTARRPAVALGRRLANWARRAKLQAVVVARRARSAARAVLARRLTARGSRGARFRAGQKPRPKAAELTVPPLVTRLVPCCPPDGPPAAPAHMHYVGASLIAA
jgi:hypothetical protein